MPDPPSQFPMSGFGFNSQHVPNRNVTGAPQQQPPSGSLQPIGGPPNSEYSDIWRQSQQQKRKIPFGGIVGSQVILDSFFVTPRPSFVFHFHHFFILSHTTLSFLPGARPRIFTLLFRHRPLFLGFAYVSSGFCHIFFSSCPSSLNSH
jgi:hypothetical protein